MKALGISEGLLWQHSENRSIQRKEKSAKLSVARLDYATMLASVNVLLTAVRNAGVALHAGATDGPKRDGLAGTIRQRGPE